MLKGIDPVLTPELLKVLMEMGHDDAIVLADANFTAVRYANGKPIIRLPGIGMARAVAAVTSLLPLVADEVHPVGYMQVSNHPADYRSELQREVLAKLEPTFLSGQKAEAIERYAFYERTKNAFAIVLTGELQPFGNFLLRKGVIGDNLRP
jgi:L-fucose mutarotase